MGIPCRITIELSSISNDLRLINRNLEILSPESPKFEKMKRNTHNRLQISVNSARFRKLETCKVDEKSEEILHFSDSKQ